MHIAWIENKGYKFMLRAGVLLFCWLFVTNTAHAKYEFLLHKTYAERYHAIDTIFYYTDLLGSDSNRFYTAINQLAGTATKGKDKELLCEARLLSIAYNIVGGNKVAAKVEPEAFALLKIAEQEKLLQIQVRVRQFLGRYYLEQAGKYTEALDHFLTSYYLMQKLAIQDFPTKKEHLYNIAHAYYNFGDYTSAKQYLLEADKADMPFVMHRNKIFMYVNLKNTLGLIYRNEQRYDSAEYYFKIVHGLAVQKNDSAWIGIALGNLGISYYLQGRYNEAVPLLEKDVQESFKAQQIDNGINSLIKLSEIYLLQNKQAAALAGINTARGYIARTTEPNQHLQYLYALAGKYYAAINNMPLAYRYMDSARIAREIINTKKNAMALAREQQKLEYQQHVAELKHLEDNRKMQLLQRNSLLAGVVLLAIIFIVMINKDRLLHKQKSKLAASEKLLAETELQTATAQLESFTQSIHEKNALIEKINAEIERYKLLPDAPSIPVNHEVLTQLQQSIILTDSQWDEFKTNFEKVHTGFQARLKEKMPDLTPSETRFIVLSKLNMSNKEMAAMLGVSLQAVRTYRYRLRKKLQLPEEGSIEELINQI